MFHWITFILVCASVSFGEVVLKIDSSKTRIAVTHPEDLPWMIGNTVAVQVDGKKIAWGIVTKVGPGGAIVTITTRLSDIRSGSLLIRSELPAAAEQKPEEPAVPETIPAPSETAPKPKIIKKVKSPHAAMTMVKPKFNALFDLLFTYRAQRLPPASFENYHSLLLFTFAPNPELTFSFEVSADPRFYELDYQLSPGIELRAGKIWIPFDDDQAHKLYGGRPNILKFVQPNTQFLPEVWTDLGVGLKLNVLSTGGTEVAIHAYAVNGFREKTGGDPLPGASPAAESYPDFAAISDTDNNDDKALGGRLSISVRDFLNFGGSIYRGKYSNREKTPAALTLFGTDGNLRMGNLEFKFGYIFGIIELIGAEKLGFQKGGYYGEGGLWFGKTKASVFGGQSQNDSRFNDPANLDPTDQTVVGARIDYRKDQMAVSLEYSKDIEPREGKSLTEYWALRLSTFF